MLSIFTSLYVMCYTAVGFSLFHKVERNSGVGSMKTDYDIHIINF